MFQGLFGRGWILVAASLLCCGAALAEDDKVAPRWSSNGGAAVKLTPTILRVQVPVFGQGKTLAAALEKLKGRRESAVEKIKSLGAERRLDRRRQAVGRQRQADAACPLSRPANGAAGRAGAGSADGTPDARSPLAFLQRGKERPRATVGAAARGRATVRADAEPGVVAAGPLLWAVRRQRRRWRQVGIPTLRPEVPRQGSSFRRQYPPTGRWMPTGTRPCC